MLDPNETHKILARAAEIVADEVVKVLATNLTAGTEAALEAFNKEFPDHGLNQQRIYTLLRREICWRVAKKMEDQGNGWDDLLFTLANYSVEKEPDQPVE